MATNPEILSQLLEILKPFTKEGLQLRGETKLIGELGLDSLQVMQVLLKIEDHFDISIPLNNLPTIQTVQELVLEIETLVKV
jgi:acyl carrier protein